MDETQAQIEAHNAAQIVDDIKQRLDSIEHEVNVITGLLDDLEVYLPKAGQDS